MTKKRNKYRYYYAKYTDELLPNGEFKRSDELGPEMPRKEAVRQFSEWIVNRVTNAARRHGQGYQGAGLGGLIVVREGS